MKEKKIYKKPKCKAIRLDTEDLCDGGLGVNSVESGLGVMGAKRNQFIIDDSDDQSQESEIL